MREVVLVCVLLCVVGSQAVTPPRDGLPLQFTTRSMPLPAKLRFAELRSGASLRGAASTECGPEKIKCVHGICTTDGRCECDSGYAGADCETLLPCGGHGAMINNTCVCTDGYSGVSCNLAPCPNACSGNGLCYHDNHKRPRCLCRFGTRGVDCSEGGCPNRCSGHGTCIEVAGGDGDETVTLCRCDAGWRNQDCSLPGCPICTHGKCIDDACVCDTGYAGFDCSDRLCPSNCTDNVHGVCNTKTGMCMCKSDWTGADCSISALVCPNDCNLHRGRGRCTKDGCVCEQLYGGPDCSLECPNGCSGRGRCLHGVCSCAGGYAAPDCATLGCPTNCSNNGLCINGTCKCHAPWSGIVCSRKECPNLCSNNGECDPIVGVCTCLGPTAARDDPRRWYLGYRGDDCSQKRCINDCGGERRGKCDGQSGKCVCAPGFVGDDCSKDACNSTCSGHGHCPDLQTGCVCDEGFKGVACETQYCPNDCFSAEGQGSCVNQTCVCHEAHTGKDCSQKKCPTSLPYDHPLRFQPLPFPTNTIPGADADPDLLACSRNGVCVNGSCACLQGYTGISCQIRTCPFNCHNNGVCNTKGACVCDEGYAGLYCEKLVDAPEVACPKNCSGNGYCINGTCYYLHGLFFGQDGSKVRIPCPAGCEVNGRCDFSSGKCMCNEGRTGPDCSQQLCRPSPDCSGHGRCAHSNDVFGVCVCDEGYTGPACKDVLCSRPCNGQGACVNGRCYCRQGWTGADCEEEICPRNCSLRGECTKTGCSCPLGWGKRDCSEVLVSCPRNCSGVGQCQYVKDVTAVHGVRGECQCRPGWSGPSCETALCPMGCNEDKHQGKCVAPGTCRCSENFYGPTCGEVSCPNACSNNGVCENHECRCYEGWGGLACAVRLGCPDKCREHGTCMGNTCVCEEGFYGPLCDQIYCPNNCTDRGTCAKGKCECWWGFGGSGCEKLENEALCLASCQLFCDKNNEGHKNAPWREQLAHKRDCLSTCSLSRCGPTAPDVARPAGNSATSTDAILQYLSARDKEVAALPGGPPTDTTTTTP